MFASKVPLRLSKDPPPQQRTPAGRIEEPDTQPITKVRILIVEDEFLVAMTLEHELSESGYEIAGVAGSADAAAEMAHRERPAFILMDIRLAGARDGIDAALQIFSETGIRCLFATANADETSRKRAALARPLGWLQKPYHHAALISAISEAIKALSQ